LINYCAVLWNTLCFSSSEKKRAVINPKRDDKNQWSYSERSAKDSLFYNLIQSISLCLKIEDRNIWAFFILTHFLFPFSIRSYLWNKFIVRSTEFYFKTFLIYLINKWNNNNLLKYEFNSIFANCFLSSKLMYCFDKEYSIENIYYWITIVTNQCFSSPNAVLFLLSFIFHIILSKSSCIWFILNEEFYQ
jgi:hypothetical protein